MTVLYVCTALCSLAFLAQCATAFIPLSRLLHSSRRTACLQSSAQLQQEGTSDQLSRGYDPNGVRAWPISEGPVLTVRVKESNCTVHLVGVSHGSLASSSLVSRVMREVNPASVIVELCVDRFISISLDAGIRPRMNATLESMYDDKMAKMQQVRRRSTGGGDTSSNNNGDGGGGGDIPLSARLGSAVSFARGQGLVGGMFVLLGLTVSFLQRVSSRTLSVDSSSTSSSSGESEKGVTTRIETQSYSACDEFVTAMREAEALSIPLILGDAAQNDTLDSVKGVFSSAMFDPARASENALFLAFSAFGLYARESYSILAEKNIDSSVLAQSEWVNIPSIYARSRAMLKSLVPFLGLATFTATLGYLPDMLQWVSQSSSSSSSSSVGVDAASSVIVATTDNSGFDVGGTVQTLLNADLPLWVQQSIDIAADIFSLLLLVRLGKIIGTDRDKIIAANVRDAALVNPDSEVVVVIGMLHCNGVARWLLSGVDPYAFEHANGVR